MAQTASDHDLIEAACGVEPHSFGEPFEVPLSEIHWRLRWSCFGSLIGRVFGMRGFVVHEFDGPRLMDNRLEIVHRPWSVEIGMVHCRGDATSKPVWRFANSASHALSRIGSQAHSEASPGRSPTYR